MPTIIDGNTGVQTSKVLGSDTPPTAANELTRKDYVDGKVPTRVYSAVTLVAGTVYTNNTSGDIIIGLSIVASGAGNYAALLTVGGQGAGAIGGTAGVVGTNGLGTFVVPPGLTYSFSLSNATFSSAWKLSA